jgi:hypothetical protein
MTYGCGPVWHAGSWALAFRPSLPSVGVPCVEALARNPETSDSLVSDDSKSRRDLRPMPPACTATSLRMGIITNYELGLVRTARRANGTRSQGFRRLGRSNPHACTRAHRDLEIHARPTRRVERK